MRDSVEVEDIMAEPDDVSSLWASFAGTVSETVMGNGWLILGLLCGTYYIWKHYLSPYRAPGNQTGTKKPMTDKEIEQFRQKEEARRRYVEKLQEQYQKESEEQAEKAKLLAEEKRKSRLKELETLEGKGGSRLGRGEPGPSSGSSANFQPNSSSNKKPKTPSLRPEYNPLMGDSSSSRLCFRPSGGRSGG